MTALLVAAAVGSCRREREAAFAPASPADAVAPSRGAPAGDASAGSSPPDGLAEAPRAAIDAAAPAPSRSPLMDEVQAIVEAGSDPGKLARLIGAHAAEPDALLARKTALYVLKGVSPPQARLAALIQAAATGGGVAPEADPLWPELVDALAETWDYENTAAGRRRMLRERDPRVRRLLVASMARYAGSSRGLSNLSNSERRALRAELRSLRPQVPPEVRADIDATLPKLVHDSHVLD